MVFVWSSSIFSAEVVFDTSFDFSDCSQGCILFAAFFPGLSLSVVKCHDGTSNQQQSQHDRSDRRIHSGNGPPQDAEAQDEDPKAKKGQGHRVPVCAVVRVVGRVQPLLQAGTQPVSPIPRVDVGVDPDDGWPTLIRRTALVLGSPIETVPLGQGPAPAAARGAAPLVGPRGRRRVDGGRGRQLHLHRQGIGTGRIGRPRRRDRVFSLLDCLPGAAAGHRRRRHGALL